MIKQGDKLYIDAIEAFSVTWEQLLEDERSPKFTEEVHQIELKIVAVKADMVKIYLKENIAKVVELKEL